MTQILKGAYIKDSDGGTPIIKLEDGNIYWYGSPGKPPTSGFFKILGGSWCYISNEQEYNQQEDTFFAVDTQEDSAAIQKIVEAKREFQRKLALMHDYNNELKVLCESFPEKEAADTLLLLGGITDSVSLALKYFSEHNPISKH